MEIYNFNEIFLCFVSDNKNTAIYVGVQRLENNYQGDRNKTPLVENPPRPNW